MAAADKDTIYIDIDDEITGIIDKLKGSNGKVVALVLPKRASVFQSIVNMKLLKRAAESGNKHIVLITSEAGLMPLAGAAGVHVAKTLTSKPEIPSGPDMGDDAEDEEIEENLGDDPEPDPTKPIGQLAGGAAAAKAADDVETLVLDDDDLPPEADDAKPVPKTFDPPKGKKKNKLAVPNFERFRLLLIAGGLALILLIAGIIFAVNVLPKATIIIKTNASTVDTNLGLNLSTTAKELNLSDGTLPAKLAQTQKTYTQQVPTTGQKNNGNKASGSVSLVNCSQSDDISLPAGTGVSSGGNTYITQEAVTIPVSSFKKNICQKDEHKSVSVVAQNGGTSYNLPGGASFTVAGQPSLSGEGSGISGGTDSIVQTVNQNDINAAKAKITVNEAEIKKTLNDLLSKDKLYAITATYVAGTPNTTSSAKVGEVANNVTVTEVVTYTMFGVKEGDIEKLLENAIKEQIDEEQQSILDNGLSKANYNVDEISATAAKLTMSATASAGPDLDIATIKENAAGQKPGAIKGDLGNNPDVTDVDVKLSPFWVSSVPKKLDKIKVEIAKPQAKASSSNASDN